ncbi:TlpA family protein disulfide reductase [Pelagibius sp.]|uniref:TlpA family protein disulfide reductase n=1 Tax=Pelagibius sp. TaxID=1931238 RepID=UPI003B50B18A
MRCARSFAAGPLACLLVALLLAAAPAQAEPVQLNDQRVEALGALPSLRGAAVTSEALAGRAVVVAFWASWCPPCHPEFDNLARLQETYGDEVAIVAVNIFEEFGRFTGTTRRDAFLAKKKPPFHVVAEGEQVAGLFQDVTRIPTVFVFAPNGRPVMHFIHHQGATKTHASYEELRAAVGTALARQAAGG